MGEERGRYHDGDDRRTSYRGVALPEGWTVAVNRRNNVDSLIFKSFAQGGEISVKVVTRHLWRVAMHLSRAV